MSIEQGFVLGLFLVLAALAGYVLGHHHGAGDAMTFAKRHLRDMKIEGDEVIFSSGRTRYANNGIIGLDSGDNVSEGYDGGFWQPDDWNNEKLSTDDLAELADFMVARWQAWKARNAAAPGNKPPTE